MISENVIALKEECKTPEEAVSKAGELLLKNGNVTQNYVDAMVRSYKVNGAYIVIAPRFAMPHARPEEGVLKAGFSILTLKTPIEFGSIENDPVDLVIGLAAANSDEHVEVIQKITEIFSDKEKSETIFNAESKEDIMKLF
jgi:PTS system ascorbate-specific IIA component